MVESSTRAAIAARSCGTTFIFRHIDWDRFLDYEIVQKRKSGIFKSFEVLQRDMRFDESNRCCLCDQ